MSNQKTIEVLKLAHHELTTLNGLYVSDKEDFSDSWKADCSDALKSIESLNANKCTEERKCQMKKQQFLDGLNELSEKLGLFLEVDQSNGELAISELPENCLIKGYTFVSDSPHHIIFQFH